MLSIQAMQEEIRREEQMEVRAALTLLSYRDGEMFAQLAVRPHAPTLSRTVAAEIRRFPAPEMRLCGEITARVLEALASYKSFRTLLASEGEAFRGLLEVYVARQLLLAKCRQGTVISPQARQAAALFLAARLTEAAVAAGLNRAAGELASCGLTPREALEALSSLVRGCLEEALRGGALPPYPSAPQLLPGRAAEA